MTVIGSLYNRNKKAGLTNLGLKNGNFWCQSGGVSMKTFDFVSSYKSSLKLTF